MTTVQFGHYLKVICINPINAAQAAKMSGLKMSYLPNAVVYDMNRVMGGPK